MSQLDFDLQGPPRPEPEPAVMTVAVLTRRVRELLEAGIGEVWVEGEVSNVRRQSSGHIYFTLKDSASQLSCVLFAGHAMQVWSMAFADGLQVQVMGEVTVYEPRGQYQMVVRKVRERGAGALQAKFDELKRRLSAEGLFDADRKRALPRFPQRIGVVTSPTGAAIRDFLNVLHRRHGGIAVVINPVRVQGRGAAAEIARAIGEFGDPGFAGPVDVIVVTRGGGSIEDLWEFNEEVVARAVAASRIPVVSAIGHEIDFTICDFAADLRAPTPSAAAEILSADREEVLERIGQLSGRLLQPLSFRLRTLRDGLAALPRTALFQQPVRAVREAWQTLDRSAEDLRRSAERTVEVRRRAADAYGAALAAHSPARRIAETLGRMRLSLERMESLSRRAAGDLRSRADKASAILAALNPQAALERGYTITRSSDGRAIRSAAGLMTGDVLTTQFRDGSARSVVTHGASGQIAGSDSSD
jgi:exodeoxyribonuclease VII large subunit